MCTPTKICTHEELATVITAGYFYPRKFNPQNIVTTKNCTFTVLCKTDMTGPRTPRDVDSYLSVSLNSAHSGVTIDVSTQKETPLCAGLSYTEK